MLSGHQGVKLDLLKHVRELIQRNRSCDLIPRRPLDTNGDQLSHGLHGGGRSLFENNLPLSGWGTEWRKLCVYLNSGLATTFNNSQYHKLSSGHRNERIERFESRGS